MNYLAFDLGGSSGKLSLATVENGTIQIEEIHSFKNQPVSSDGHLYWDISGICASLYEGIRKAVEKTGDRIDSIAFDSFCNDYVLLSEEGQMLSPVYCYRDERTARCKAHTYQVMSPERLYQINGNQMALFNTLLQLDAMKQEGQGDLLDRAHRLLFVSDYFIWLLTGKEVTEYTTASVTQMYDYAKDSWSDEILSAFGIRRSLFAPVVKPGTFIGKTTEAFCEKAGTKGFRVTAACHHDTASAFLASVGTGQDVILSAGTWCLIGIEAEAPLITPEGFARNLANEGGYPGHHRILRNVMGTWILQEILREQAEGGLAYTFEEIDGLAEQSLQVMAGQDWLWFDVDAPAFYQPGGMMEKVRRGCMDACGRMPKDLGETVCAVYVSLALKYRDTIGLLERLQKRTLSSVNIIGGGSRSSLMCRITANVCGRPVLAGPADATAYGNVMVQMLADGTISSVEEGRQMIRESIPTKVYIPQDQALWEKRYQYLKERLFFGPDQEKGE